MKYNPTDLKLSIDRESLNIYFDQGEDKEPIHVVYWHIDEVEEDATVAISMVNAVHLFYTNPKELLAKANLDLIENFHKNRT